MIQDSTSTMNNEPKGEDYYCKYECYVPTYMDDFLYSYYN